MVTNRYFQRKAAQPDFYKEDLDMLANTLNIKQDAYNTYLGAADELSAINVDRLEQDNAAANNQIDQYQKQIDNLVESVGGDYSKLGKDLHNLGRDITKDMSPGGKLYSIATNKANFDKEDAFNKEMLTKGVINLRQYDAWKNNTKSSYTGAVSDREGVYNMLNPESITKAVNITDFYDKIASKVIPEKFQTGAFKYNPKTGITYENTSSGYERLTQKRLSAILDQAAASDQDWLSYSGQLAGWGDPITQDEINAAKARALNTYGFNHTNYSTNGGFIPEWVSKMGQESDTPPTNPYVGFESGTNPKKDSAMPNLKEELPDISASADPSKAKHKAVLRASENARKKAKEKWEENNRKENKPWNAWNSGFIGPTLLKRGYDNLVRWDAKKRAGDTAFFKTYREYQARPKEAYKYSSPSEYLANEQKYGTEAVSDFAIKSTKKIEDWVAAKNPNIDRESQTFFDKVFKEYDDARLQTVMQRGTYIKLLPKEQELFKDMYVTDGSILEQPAIILGTDGMAVTDTPKTTKEALEDLGYDKNDMKDWGTFSKNINVVNVDMGTSSLNGQGIQLSTDKGKILVKNPDKNLEQRYSGISEIYSSGEGDPNSNESVTRSIPEYYDGLKIKTTKDLIAFDAKGHPVSKPQYISKVVAAEPFYLDGDNAVNLLVGAEPGEVLNIPEETKIQILQQAADKGIIDYTLTDNNLIVKFKEGYELDESILNVGKKIAEKNAIPTDENLIIKETTKQRLNY